MLCWSSVSVSRRMSESTVIRRRSLHDELVVLVRDMILDGELVPGQKISEQALCARFGVSRTPLREALKVLAAEGVIELLPNRGATVARITSEAIEELFPIMAALEALAGEQACRRIDEAGMARIRALHEEMMACYRRGEKAGYANLNRAIHEALFEIAGNATLTQIYNSLMVRIHSIRFFAKRSAARWRASVEDHERILEALEARDGPRLAAILKDHLLGQAADVARDTLEPADEMAAE